MKQNNWPLKQALEEFRNLKQMPLHMPGHKQGRSLQAEWLHILGQAAAFDYTEIPATDDLAQPIGPIKKSQELLAQLYGADQSFYLINGTSGGIMASMLAHLKAGDEVLLSRNSHRSISQGVILSGATPVYINPEFDAKHLLPLPLSTQAIEAKLQEHQNIRLCVLTSPCYYGLIGDLKEQVGLLHRYDIPVLIDEAHGAHLNFSENLGIGGLEAGADLVAQSPHKILSSFTQSSWLHIQGPRVDKERLKASLRMMQSTSASYILLLSLEAAVAQMYTDGPEKLNTMLDNVKRLRQNLVNNGFSLLNLNELDSYLVKAHDISKIYINTLELGLKGYDAARLLRAKGIEPELSDYAGVLLMFTLADDRAFIEQVETKLLEFASEQKKKPRSQKTEPLSWADLQPEIILNPREAWFAGKEKVSFNQAENRIVGETITIYPPGVPIVLPGELISKEILTYLKQIKAQGGNIVCDDPTLNTLTCIVS